MDIFEKAQKLHDEAKAHLRSISTGSTIEKSMYENLLAEYALLLAQAKLRSGQVLSGCRTIGSVICSNETPAKVYFDELTGIFSRRYLDENIGGILSGMCRSTDMMSMMLIDMDAFERYNETYGKSAGDECLCYIAEAIKSCLFRGNDFVVRFTDDKFMVALPYTDTVGACSVAGRILDRVRELGLPHSTSPICQNLSVSIGVVSGFKIQESSNWNAEGFYERATAALAWATDGGCNQYVHYMLDE